ncbi:hypothetical protein HUJ05_007740 [Dendroctonus ponderosae]|nr:hypothetical protein HUJ05_007740 [Dendroctonus ponderosae]
MSEEMSQGSNRFVIKLGNYFDEDLTTTQNSDSNSPSSFPPMSDYRLNQPTSLPPNIALPQQPASQHPAYPPPYPNPPHGNSPLPSMNHNLLQQQLLQNPHFAAARDNVGNSPLSVKTFESTKETILKC